MKHFNIEKQQTAIFEKFGAFFAFGQKQFDERKKEGVTYVNAGAGLLAPKGTAEELCADLAALSKNKIQWELDNNSVKDIIFYSLGNYECQISSDYSDAVDAVKYYGITEAEVAAVWPEYWNHCVDNDYF